MRKTTFTTAILLLSTGLLTALPAATEEAPSPDGDDGEALECIGGGEVTEIAPGVGTCDQDGDGQPDQVVGHVPLPGIGTIGASAGQFVIPFGTGTFFIVHAETEEESPVGENRAGVSGICFSGSAVCSWVNVGAVASTGDSSPVGEREAFAVVDCGGVFGQACVPDTPKPTVGYEDENRRLNFEQTPFGPWYNLDYEEDGVGAVHFTGGTFVFLVRITGGTLEAETAEESPVGHNEARVTSFCVGVLTNPCLASLTQASASTGEDTPLGENDVFLDTITCQPVDSISCRGGVLSQTNTGIDSEHLGKQSLTVEAFPNGPVNICTGGDHVDEGCQTISV